MLVHVKDPEQGSTHRKTQGTLITIVQTDRVPDPVFKY